MINPTGKKLEKLLFGMLDDAIQGVDRYNHNGSMWLIFTDEMRWVVEYTKSQTLWYNYYFFKQEMEIIGLDCVDNKDLIQKWFESRFLNKLKAQDTLHALRRTHNIVEHTIQNGVKHTSFEKIQLPFEVEDTIQNGVKHALEISNNRMRHDVEDTIQNGVKGTTGTKYRNRHFVEDTIQNGVKQTELSKRDFFPKDIIQDGLKINGTYVGGKRQKENVENIIKNGVKHIEDGDWLDGDERIEGIIQEGVKETNQDCSDNIARVEGIIRIGEKLN